MPFPRPPAAFYSGFRACVPVVPGVVTFGVICGVAMTGAGLSAWTTVLMSVIVFAGTSQLAALQLALSGTPLPMILLAATIINLRFALYSLSTAPYFRDARTSTRAWASYVLSDNGFAHFIARFGGQSADQANRIPYFFGACVAIWIAWQSGTAAGAVIGAGIPANWGLEFTVTLTFVALAISTIRDRATLVAALAAGTVAALAYPLPYRAGLILAAMAGIAAGMGWEKLERTWTRSPSP